MRMQRDRLYAKFNPQLGAFRFDEQVVEVFDDMIERSVPGYRTILAMLSPLAARYATPKSHLYDLGCSLGASSAALLQGIKTPSCKLIAVDNSTAMIEHCKKRLSSIDTDTVIEIVCADLQDLPIEKASMVVLNFTLQFIRPSARAKLLSSIASGMKNGGVLVLSEKIALKTSTCRRKCVNYMRILNDSMAIPTWRLVKNEVHSNTCSYQKRLKPITIDCVKRVLSKVETCFQSLNFLLHALLMIDYTPVIRATEHHTIIALE